MMKPRLVRKTGWRNRIGIKLFGLLSVVIVLALLPFSYLVLEAVNSFGHYSASVNESQIKQQAIEYLLRLSHEQGLKTEEYFNRVNTAATLMALSAHKVYSEPELTREEPNSSLVLTYQEENNMFLTAADKEVTTVYWGGEYISGEVEAELQDLVQMDAVLKKVKDLLPESHATHIITLSGIGKYYTWREESKVAVRHLPKTSEFDLRDGEPLTIFTKKNKAADKSQWTDVYKDDVIEGLMITASSAILNNNGALKGIVGIDLPLQKVVDDLLVNNTYKLEEKSKILFSFLVNSHGQIIAFPTQYLDTFGFTIDLANFKYSEDILNFYLKDSHLKGVRSLTSSFLEKDNNVIELLLEGEKYFVATQTLPSLNWTFASVTRQTDLLSSVKKTQLALQGTLDELGKGFLINCLAIGCFTLLLVYIAVRYFVGPLQKLTITAQEIGRGNLSVECDIDRGDELGDLGLEMNKMITQLSAVDELKANYFKRLRLDIKSRTKDLEEKNIELEDVVKDLHRESEDRKKITLALKESEQQLRSIMSSSLTSLCIIQDEKFSYVNDAIAKLFGYSQEELLNCSTPIILVLPGYQAEILKAVDIITSGGTIKQNWPYYIQCRRRDGTIFDAQVEAAEIVWKGKPAIVTTIVDISPLKKSEQKLLSKEKRLQDSLEEKNILLREVYHRTKNNMLVIISMLNLQLDGIEDEKAKRVFVETENRIRAMALVHESLYNSKNLAEINLGKYLDTMVKTLVRSITVGDLIRVSVQYTSRINIPFEQAIPLGMVVNELVTNSVKHGFREGQAGEVRIEINQNQDGYDLIVADNGIGIPKEINPHKSNTFGMQIAANMIEMQLGATFEVDCSRGTQYKIKLVQSTGDGSKQSNPNLS